MNRFSAILYTMLMALVVCLLAPFVITSLRGTSPPLSSRSGWHWTFQDRVDYTLWMIQLREHPPDIWMIEYIREQRKDSWGSVIASQSLPTAEDPPAVEPCP